MKQIFLVIVNTQEHIHELLVDVGSLDLVVDGIVLTLDSGSKVETNKHELTVNLISTEGTEVDNWEELPFLDVFGEVWIDTEYPFEDLYAYIVVQDNEFKRRFSLSFV